MDEPGYPEAHPAVERRDLTPQPGNRAAEPVRPRASGTTAEKIADLRARRESARHVPDRTVRRLARFGRMTARDRLEYLLDPGSFVETGLLARHRSTGFAADTERPSGDGVITGHGTVAGRQVCVYAQDAQALGGSVGEVFGEKVGKLLDLALHTGCPVVAINDSSGARVSEGVLSLAAYGRVASKVVTASGVIPQISLIMGPCAGGAVYVPAFTDFVVMVDRTSHMFVTGPDVIRKVTGEKVRMEDLGGAHVHATVTGNAHYLAENEAEALDYVRDLLSFLPPNNLGDAPVYESAADPDITSEDLELDSILPDAQREAFDMAEVIARVVDDSDLLEVQPGFAQNIICGFGRIEGRAVGIVANQPQQLAGALDIAAAEKGARFIRFCDTFNIPIVTFVDVPGFLPGTVQEHQGIIRRGSKLGFAYIEATVPKVTVIVRKAIGGGYAVMGSKELSADMCFAWPTAWIGVMGAASAVDMLCHRELATADDPGELREELIEEYEETMLTPYMAAERGSLDDVITPSETRLTVLRALRALRNKRVTLPPRKHSNIPL
ncbi:acyl-CoA carboxylase subunit beta [Streptomyces boncukensis]|uniref:Acyl-CoA carboxylase subunit beta n=1 Tax=Streptomyces boncukensis TaxID=2711219 RepID=A0A6G4X0X0_9ACTN|nr:acyl-CoA carboxylase subunit beta [Streptomyces boncukensis]NGO70394.1 acyl-CoA carboxylase subunit beta [Streptomyces boncukensis]